MYLVRAPCKKTDRSVGMSLDKYEYIMIIIREWNGECTRATAIVIVPGRLKHVESLRVVGVSSMTSQCRQYQMEILNQF